MANKLAKKPLFLQRNLSYLRKEFDRLPSTLKHDLDCSESTKLEEKESIRIPSIIGDSSEQIPINKNNQLANLKLKLCKLYSTSKNVDEYIKQTIELNKLTKNQLTSSINKTLFDFSCSYMEVYLKNEKSTNKINGNLIGRCSINDIIIDRKSYSKKVNDLILNTINTIEIKELDMNLNNKIHIRLTLIINMSKILKQNDSKIENEETCNNSKISTIKLSTKYRRTWPNQNMKKAIRAVKINGITLFNAAKLFSVPISTLSIYLRDNRRIREFLDRSKSTFNNINYSRYSISHSNNEIGRKEESKTKTQTIEIEDEEDESLYSSTYSTSNKEIQFVKEFFVEFTIGKYQLSKRLNTRNNFIDLDLESDDFMVKLALNDLDDDFECDLISNKTSSCTNNFVELRFIQSRIEETNEEVNNKSSSKQNDKMDIDNETNNSYLNKNDNSKLGIIAFSAKTNAKLIKCPFCKNIRFKHLNSLKMHLDNFHIHFCFKQSSRVMDGKKQFIFEIEENHVNISNNKLDKYKNFFFFGKKSKPTKKINLVEKFYTYLKKINLINDTLKKNYVKEFEEEKDINLQDQITDELKTLAKENGKGKKTSEQLVQIDNENDKINQLKQKDEIKILAVEPSGGGDSLEKNYDAFKVKEREVYSSKNYIKKKSNEIDYDSDQEKYPDWLKDQTKNMLNDFNDVNDGEKEFMKLWNLFTMRNECIADCQLMSILELFVVQEAKSIFDLKLFNNFLLHLANLCDYDLINTTQMIELIDLIKSKETFNQSIII